MGKVITLENWISPALIKSDADIPANSDDMVISGQDITCTNIKLSDISNLLTSVEEGLQTYSLYDLGRYYSINKWSKFRPGTWNDNGVSGSNWLPSGNSQPTFTPKYENYSSMGDFALYCHSRSVKKPTYYYTDLATTYIEEGDPVQVSVQYKRGYKQPVCQETGELANAWDCVATTWSISDTETGVETIVNTDPVSGGNTVPELGADPEYLTHSTSGLSEYISVGQSKWIHCRPYYTSGAHTKIQMIEDGQRTVQLHYTDLLCTGVINYNSEAKVHVVNKDLSCNWTVTRTVGAPGKNIEFKIVCRSAYDEIPTGSEFTSGSTPVEFGGTAGSWPNTIEIEHYMEGGDTYTLTTHVYFGASTNTPTWGNNYVQLYARISGSSTWKFLDSQRIEWIWP